MPQYQDFLRLVALSSHGKLDGLDERAVLGAAITPIKSIKSAPSCKVRDVCLLLFLSCCILILSFTSNNSHHSWCPVFTPDVLSVPFFHEDTLYPVHSLYCPKPIRRFRSLRSEHNSAPRKVSNVHNITHIPKVKLFRTPWVTQKFPAHSLCTQMKSVGPSRLYHRGLAHSSQRMSGLPPGSFVLEHPTPGEAKESGMPTLPPAIADPIHPGHPSHPEILV